MDELTKEEIVYLDYTTFTIANTQVSLISDNTDYGINTIAEINGNYHHMFSEVVSLPTAIFAFQECMGRDLTDDELKQALDDNLPKETP